MYLPIKWPVQAVILESNPNEAKLTQFNNKLTLQFPFLETYTPAATKISCFIRSKANKLIPTSDQSTSIHCSGN